MIFRLVESSLRSVFTPKTSGSGSTSLTARSIVLEDRSAVEDVWKYRNYFRPKKVKLVVLAESHVFTTAAHSSLIWKKPPAGIPAGYPNRYCCFFYCLAYGAPKPFGLSIRSYGTPAFWSIMASTIGYSGSYGSLAEKWNLLCCLQRSGVWLLDASFFAINGSTNKAADKKFMLSAQIPHILGILKKLEPDAVLVIGKNVWDFYEGLLPQIGIRKTGFIHQPNARMKGLGMKARVDQVREFSAGAGVKSACDPLEFSGGTFLPHPDVPEELEWDPCMGRAL